MASSNEIPNLKTLLGTRRGGAPRGRGRGRGGLGASSEEREQAKDDAVKGTDQDAAGSRVSCVELGYLHDPYAKLFATQQSVRRLPLLNRGTTPELLQLHYRTQANRILRPHLCNRPPRHQVPSHRLILGEANRVSRRWHRHSVLSPP